MKIRTLYLAYSLEKDMVGAPVDSGVLLGRHRSWQAAGRRLARAINSERKLYGPGWYFAVDVDTGEERSRIECNHPRGFI